MPKDSLYSVAFFNAHEGELCSEVVAASNEYEAVKEAAKKSSGTLKDLENTPAVIMDRYMEGAVDDVWLVVIPIGTVMPDDLVMLFDDVL